MFSPSFFLDNAVEKEPKRAKGTLNGSLQKVSVMVLLAKKMKKLVKLLCLLAELESLARFFFCFALEPCLFKMSQ